LRRQLTSGYKDFPICQAIERHSLTALLQAISSTFSCHLHHRDCLHCADL
jgi:hypothetical protein